MKEIEPKFRTGDQVVLLDGRRTFPHPLWASSDEPANTHPLWVPSMDKFVGSVGTVVKRDTASSTETYQYLIEFDGTGSVIARRWWVLEQWIEPMCQLSDSGELYSFFEEIGG